MNLGEPEAHPAEDRDPPTEVFVRLDTTWMVRAACKGRTDLFFGIAGERPERRVRREAAAREVCARCPVIDSCRLAARLNRESGFWGGETEEQRAAAGFPPRAISRRGLQSAATQGNRKRRSDAALPAPPTGTSGR